MKIWIIIIFSLSISLIYGQNQMPKELGIGFVISENPYLYENGSHPKDIFIDSLLMNKINVDDIFPFFYKPDYGLYHFICLEKSDKYFKILINDSEIAFIPNNKNFIFKTWETILMTATIQRIDKLNLIRNSPKETENNYITNDCKNEVLKVTNVIERKGEFWLEISFAVSCKAYIEEQTELKKGWIKWRNSSKLLVRIFLLH